jgi:hypothetical protein
MRLTNVSGVPAAWTMGFRRDGRELLVVMAKATYVLPRDGEEPAPAPEQVPLVEADVFTAPEACSSRTIASTIALSFVSSINISKFRHCKRSLRSNLQHDDGDCFVGYRLLAMPG